jgi:excisionase family DNA binding protein
LIHLKKGGKKPGQKTLLRAFAPPDKIALTKQEVSYHLGLGVRKVDELISSGQLRASAISKRTIRILRCDLLAFLQARANQ